MSVVPYKDSNDSKKEQVADMFDSISGKYDFLNRLLSGGVDIYWRKKALSMIKDRTNNLVLDIATGTGDLAIEANKILQVDKIIGVDISEGMLNVGKEKIKKLGLTDKIELQMGDSEKLLFNDNTFDTVIVSFGVRNFENLLKGLTDMCRVLKPGGTCLVVEFSKPASFPFKQFYWFYSTKILPIIGKLVSKDSSAYSYLPESVKAFPDGKAFLDVFEQAGFKETSVKTLTFGICSIYLGKK
ncbi:bifunctional demethylmenaquinone methyltransferase/2-methoxy-6-polyprenyl-1,4-benzoquinol methylase UbiE [Lacihabitans sp. CS3-21]|jgi:demethylmenaquinone methyltransferase/2-methoxy-6-polyprenyl-1,4-benzoquinol methylase|uniref:bifunctional demethylmenaquinone methyltransferase/2-methoxy-6-polyprenyl-1,4-benzoquinol methylase UbiE n=1 Tax=Lacihabitans sp. CS3-21 TaxID=2487332 RepID=UPI0020CE9A96|nr:bifunctional demethylmenaquinone methyltransferase/2-methoxy-6-polyprenyl-1,4-benzoquinol methylase UbiE [Lacihabitans sp. CS3-21]MCP9745560.1 bifunctional demethylmenaquinone methyltransferase/2-methoxy-6-polyprenyl-1,4-benzoquinol methylase UbiE [Lacihabitans sp. CS3-21]